MSQIASAYIVSTGFMDTLGNLAAAGHYASFWIALHTGAQEIKPQYEYSGYVVAVSAAFAEESGIPIPVNSSHCGAQAIINSGLSMLLCASKTEATSTLQGLSKLHSGDEHLQSYYEEFTGTSWVEAGVAMQSALNFLKFGLQQVQSDNLWLLVFVG